MRNYSTLELEPARGLNVFVGDNAQGKSNLLEAICLLGTGKSFRTAKEGDLIKESFEIASVSGEAQLRAGSVRLSCTITSTPRGTRKIYTLNGQGVKYAKYLGSAKVVTFIPADLQLVNGPPHLRRSMLNTALAQDEPLYYRNLARYQKTVSQKNAMLRGSVPMDAELLQIYNQALVETGTAIMLSRAHFITALNRGAQSAHHSWVGNAEHLELRYEPSVAFEVPTQDAVSAALSTKIAQVYEQETARKAALVGPHRDDLAFVLDGHSLSAYGSQGQQRTAVLALKVAEYNVMHERSDEAPLLLLDDVLSELDPQRAHAFMLGVGAFEQAFLTTTALPSELRAASVYRIANATVERAA